MLHARLHANSINELAKQSDFTTNKHSPEKQAISAVIFSFQRTYIQIHIDIHTYMLTAIHTHIHTYVLLCLMLLYVKVWHCVVHIHRK